MTDLQQDLEELSATLPSVPERVQELLADAQALSAAVSSLEDNLRAASDELSKSVTATHTALPDLARQVQAARERLAASAHAATQAWQDAREDLEDAVQAVERHVDDADRARLSLQQELAEWTSRAIASSAATATLEVAAAASAAAEHVEGTVEAVEEQGAALRAAVEGELQTLQADGTALHKRLLDVAVLVKGGVGYMTGEELFRRMSHDARERSVAADQVESRATALVADLEAQIASLVTTPLRTVADRVASVLTNWGSAASTYADALREVRDPLLGGFSGITEATSPLAGVYAEVEDATQRISGP